MSGDVGHGLEAQPASEWDNRHSAIVERNVAMMSGAEMEDVLVKESLGGNAGSVELNGEWISCVAINGFADRATGSITVFGNPQSVDKAIVKRDGLFTFLLAPSPRCMETRIVNFLPRESEIQPEGLAALRASISLYNEQAPELARIAIAEAKARYGSVVMRTVGSGEA